MDEVLVRPAREADATDVDDVLRACGRALPMDLETLVYAAGGRVAVRAGRVVGVAVVWPRPHSLLVERIAALDAEGFTALLDTAEREADWHGLGLVRVHAADDTERDRLLERGYLETEPLVLELVRA